MTIAKPLVALAALTLLAGCGKAGEAGNTTASAENTTAVAEAPFKFELPAGVYKNDHLHSSLLWSVPHMGMSNYTAKFNTFEAVINLDPVDVTKSTVKLTVDPTSVSTYYPTADYKRLHGDRPFKGWDDELATSDRWFNAGKFPVITFTSTKVEKTGDRTAKVTGDLDFLGQSKPVVMTVNLIGQRAGSGKRAPRFGLRAEGTFDRTTYGMKVGAALAPVTVILDGEFSSGDDTAG